MAATKLKSSKQKKDRSIKLVPVVRTLEKECFIYGYFFITVGIKSMYRIYKRTKLGWNFSIKKVKYIENCFFLCGHLEMKNQWK